MESLQISLSFNEELLKYMEWDTSSAHSVLTTFSLLEIPELIGCIPKELA